MYSMLSLSHHNLCDLILWFTFKIESTLSVFGASLPVAGSSAHGNSTNDHWKCTYTESFLISGTNKYVSASFCIIVVFPWFAILSLFTETVITSKIYILGLQMYT